MSTRQRASANQSSRECTIYEKQDFTEKTQGKWLASIVAAVARGEEILPRSGQTWRN